MISRGWLRKEEAAVDKRSPCELTDRNPDHNMVEHSYRAYLIGRSGQILRRIDLLCASDESAKAHAKRLLDGFTVELWEAARLVAVFHPN
jgi:hypothetical protein